MSARKVTKAAIATNQPTIVDKAVLRTSAWAGHVVNNTQAAVAIAPIGYNAVRAKHDLNARIVAAQAYAATL